MELLDEITFIKLQLEELENLVSNNRDLYDSMTDQECLEYIKQKAEEKLEIKINE